MGLTVLGHNGLMGPRSEVLPAVHHALAVFDPGHRRRHTALIPALIAQVVFKPHVTELLHGAPEPDPDPDIDPGVLVAYGPAGQSGASEDASRM